MFRNNGRAVHVAGGNFTEQRQLMSTRRYRWTSIWFMVGAIVSVIISSALNVNACGIENDLPCPNFYVQSVVVGDGWCVGAVLKAGYRHM